LQEEQDRTFELCDQGLDELIRLEAPKQAMNLEEQIMRFMKYHSHEEDDYEDWLKWVDHEK
jgi:hypothetical protein